MLLSKKSGGIRFATDFRKLNLQVQFHLNLLPNVNDALRKIEGFDYYTFLDINMGCYHILLDKKSQELFRIILTWGKCACTQLLQSLNYSLDVFKEKMDAMYS